MYTSQSYLLSQMVAYPTFPSCICFFKFSMLWMDSTSPPPLLVSPPPLPLFLSPEFLPLSSYLISMLRPVGAISPSCLHSFLPPCLSDIGSVGQRILTDIACSPWIQSSFYSQSLPLSLSLSLFHKNRSSQLHGHPWLKVVLTLLPFLLPASSPRHQSSWRNDPSEPPQGTDLILAFCSPPMLCFTHYLPDLS